MPLPRNDIDRVLDERARLNIKLKIKVGQKLTTPDNRCKTLETNYSADLMQGVIR